MTSPQRGIHEALVTEGLKAELEQLGRQLRASQSDLHHAEAADRLALHISRFFRRFLDDLPDDERVSLGVRLCRELIAQVIAARPKSDAGETSLLADLPIEPGQVLREILGLRPDGNTETIRQPVTPLLDTTLLANSRGEPSVGREIESEIYSADRIDVIVAFLRRSGLRIFERALADHCAAGRSVRVLTTIYTGTTEAAALERLIELGAQVRVSYDTAATRLHAKAWLFHRESGFSTAYIGSSNLTQQAQISGQEWNVRVSGARNPDVVAKMSALFESSWESPHYEPFDAERFRLAVHAGERGPRLLLSPLEIRLEPFQERLLEQIELSRRSGQHRNLLVAATGTGKTVMAVMDYLRLRDRIPRAKLLFVAHRKEMLEQALATLRYAMRDPSIGELWVGGQRPERFEQVFASIQSLNATGLEGFDAEHFEVVVVDEFHHAAAPSYQRLLRQLKPLELLGLTATPERSDELDILGEFGGRIAAELRLWDAIEQQRLTPFLYYGIAESWDLRQVPWKRGRGYDTEGLTKVLTADEAIARRVLQRLIEHVDDPRSMRALGFCVSVAHARFMARVFESCGCAARAVWGDSSEEERQAALVALRDGSIQVLFSVDLFNEGLDVPRVDTLLMLRPTDSPTLYLQQLGRGLRRADGKVACIVLDFVGLHRSEFRFDQRFRALLGGTRRSLEQQVEQRFPFLPAGCHLELDAVASERVLDALRAAIPSHWKEKAHELAEMVGSGEEPSLPRFLDQAGMELEDVYANQRSWSELLEAAGCSIASAGPAEQQLRRACGRLLHVDDEVRIDAWQGFLSSAEMPEIDRWGARAQRLLRMLIAQLCARVPGLSKDASLHAGAEYIWQHPQIRAELVEMLEVLRSRINHVQHELVRRPDVPLHVHARYTRVEILAAFGAGEGAKVAAWQTGVRWLPDQKADLFAFTLDKSSGGFSPTTRYKDYAISRELIHWESQSAVREDSETARRYCDHVARGSDVFLFARLNTDERAFWFLGPAQYVSHESERPVRIRWKLQVPLPGDLFAAFAAAVA